MNYVRQNYIKWASYGIVLLVCFLLQSSYGIGLRFFSVRPNVLPFVVAAVALYEGAGCAAVLGLIAGSLCDLSIVGLDGLYPLFLMVFGLFSGFFAEKYLRRNIVSGLLMGAAASIFINLVQYFFYHAIMHQTPFMLGMKVVVCELSVSLLVAPAAYGLIRWIHLRYAAEND